MLQSTISVMESRHLNVSFFTHVMMMKVMNYCLVWGSEDVEVMENGSMTYQFVHVRHSTIKWMKICADNFITAKVNLVESTLPYLDMQSKLNSHLVFYMHRYTHITHNDKHFLEPESFHERAFFVSSQDLG